MICEGAQATVDRLNLAIALSEETLESLRKTEPDVFELRLTPLSE